MSVCWWCCHSFPGPSLHCPFKYDEKKKRFSTYGHFCSWECMKSYAMDNAGARAGELQMYIMLMRKHANGGKYASTRLAPKRQTLKMFGGVLSIEDFRASTSNVIVKMPWENHMLPVLVAPSRVQHTVHTSSDETLVLKRAKPLARDKSSLETSLGITRRSK